MCCIVTLKYKKKKYGRNSFPDAGRREFSASRNQSTSSSTAEPLSKGREIRTITSRKTMIHDPDTSTFASICTMNHMKLLRAFHTCKARHARNILRRHDDKGLGLAPCPSEFVDPNICRHTQEYVRYVYYAHMCRYVSVLHPYL